MSTNTPHAIMLRSILHPPGFRGRRGIRKSRSSRRRHTHHHTGRTTGNYSPSRGGRCRGRGRGRPRTRGRNRSRGFRRRNRRGQHHRTRGTGRRRNLLEHCPRQKRDEIIKQFQQKWMHPVTTSKPRPDFSKILVYKIKTAGRWRRKKFEKYKHKVHIEMKKKGVRAFKTGVRGNTVRRFHGTKQLCDIGVNSRNLRKCGNAGCCVCGILDKGFLVSKAVGKAFQRFGTGVYFTSTSSKSHDYANVHNHNNVKWKTQFVTLVVAGIIDKQFNDQTALTAPKNGCHSVVGQASTTGSLNYDELVIYREAAILPRYLVMYPYI